MKQTTTKLINTEKKLVTKVDQHRQAVFNRFPLLFTLLGTFGVVATFYGFEGMINKVPFLTDNPWFILAAGISILAITGTLYKKLQQSLIAPYT